jgi:hypothetical protein
MANEYKDVALELEIAIDVAKNRCHRGKIGQLDSCRLRELLFGPVTHVCLELFEREEVREKINWIFAAFLGDEPTGEKDAVENTVKAIREYAEVTREFLTANRTRLEETLSYRIGLPAAPKRVAATNSTEDSPQVATLAQNNGESTILGGPEVANDLLNGLQICIEELRHPVISPADFYLPSYRASVEINEPTTTPGGMKISFAAVKYSLIEDFQPILKFGGNLIVRSMLARLDSHVRTIDYAASRIQSALARLKGRQNQPWRERKRNVDIALQELNHHCFYSDEGSLADAACQLLQLPLEASFSQDDASLYLRSVATQVRSEIDTSWLPGSVGVRLSNEGLMRSLRDGRDLTHASRVSTALRHITTWLAGLPADEFLAKQAIEKGHLVLHLNSKRLYWESKNLSSNCLKS